jgi:hypothetical protein
MHEFDVRTTEKVPAVVDDPDGWGDLAGAVDDALAGVVAAHDVALRRQELWQFFYGAAVGTFVRTEKDPPLFGIGLDGRERSVSENQIRPTLGNEAQAVPAGDAVAVRRLPLWQMIVRVAPAALKPARLGAGHGLKPDHHESASCIAEA